MTIQEFNNLTVDKLVKITVKGRNVPTAWGAASRINRTAKTIKPFCGKKWYSYKNVTIDSKKYPMSCLWGSASPQSVIELLVHDNELAKI